MKDYEQCHNVIVRLKSAWRVEDACGSLQRAKSAFLDAADILAPPDVRRIASEPVQGHATEKPGALGPQYRSRIACLCQGCAEICHFLDCMAQDDEAFKSLDFPLVMLEETKALVFRLWHPEYLEGVMAGISEVPPQYAAQGEFILLLLELVRGLSERLLLPFLDALEFELLFMNAITQIRDYLARESLARDILQAAKQRDTRRVASLVSQAGTTDPHTAGVVRVSAFTLGFCRTSIARDVLQYLRRSLVFRIVGRALQPRYYELVGGSSALDEIAQSWVDKHVPEKMEYSLPFDFGNMEEGFTQFIEQLCSTLVKQQNLEIVHLKRREQILNTCQPLSLDVDVEDENGEPRPLSEMMPAPADLEEAMPQLREIWESLEPEEAKLLSERFIEGKPLNEIAIERGWSYDRTQKRIERLMKDILNKMSD